MQERVTRTNKYSSLRTQLKVEKKAHYKKVGKLTVISTALVFTALITGLCFVVFKKVNSENPNNSKYTRVINGDSFLQLYRYSEDKDRYINITSSKSIMDDFKSNSITFEPNKDYFIYFRANKTNKDDLAYSINLIIDKENSSNYENIEYAFIKNIDENSSPFSSWDEANISKGSVRNLYNDVKEAEISQIEISKYEALIGDDTENYHALAFHTNDKYKGDSLYIDIQIKKKDALGTSSNDFSEVNNQERKSASIVNGESKTIINFIIGQKWSDVINNNNNFSISGDNYVKFDGFFLLLNGEKVSVNDELTKADYLLMKN